jgi:hypothetical protein
MMEQGTCAYNSSTKKKKIIPLKHMNTSQKDLQWDIYYRQLQ